jgi:hypothetical protein
LLTTVEAAHNVEVDVISDNGFDNIDDNGQRLRTENDSETGDTDDYSIPEQAGDCEGDFDQDGNEEIGPSSADVTKGSVLSLVFALFVRHRLTKGCLGDLLQLLNIIVPNCVPKTNYFFEKLFFPDTVVKQHFYCPDCQSYLGEPEPSSLHSCTICQIEFEEESLLKSRSFFFLAPLRINYGQFLRMTAEFGIKFLPKNKNLFFNKVTSGGRSILATFTKPPKFDNFYFLGKTSRWQRPPMVSVHSKPLS